jgi:hypothetical protein
MAIWLNKNKEFVEHIMWRTERRKKETARLIGYKMGFLLNGYHEKNI